MFLPFIGSEMELHSSLGLYWVQIVAQGETFDSSSVLLLLCTLLYGVCVCVPTQKFTTGDCGPCCWPYWVEGFGWTAEGSEISTCDKQFRNRCARDHPVAMCDGPMKQLRMSGLITRAYLPKGHSVFDILYRTSRIWFKFCHLMIFAVQARMSSTLNKSFTPWSAW